MNRTECAWITRDEVFEGYVCDTLSPEDREAFEAHYFECEACFGRIEAHQAMREELAAWPEEVTGAGQPARGWRWQWVLVPLGASIVLVAAAALWFRDSGPSELATTTARAPAAQTQPAAPQTTPAGGIPSQPQAPSAGTSPESPAPAAARPATPPVVALSVLARVEPPPFVPVTLRGPRDKAAEKFETAMRSYAGGDYAGAIPALRAAAELKPDAPQITFFLAACQLLTGAVDVAAAGFERVIALGESPYLEESHFYLAKARLQQNRVPEARAELQRTIRLGGGLEQEARDLVGRLDAFTARRDRPLDK